MKLTIISDLHLEFDDLELSGGETLVIAGDACESRTLSRNKYSPSNILNKDARGRRMDRAARFFEEECSKYDHVLYVMGNHEHYHNKFFKTAKDLRAELPSKVQLLECDTVTIDDVVFMGCTMWTDCNHYDPITLHGLADTMNDYRTITWNQGNHYRKLRPADTAAIHRKSLEWLKAELLQYPNNKVVVITHHAPSFLSVAEHYRHDRVMNGGYYSDLSDTILDNPQIKYWIHGHTHDLFDYEIGACRILCNPRGYSGHEHRADEFAELTVDI